MRRDRHKADAHAPIRAFRRRSSRLLHLDRVRHTAVVLGAPIEIDAEHLRDGYGSPGCTARGIHPRGALAACRGRRHVLAGHCHDCRRHVVLVRQRLRSQSSYVGARFASPEKLAARHRGIDGDTELCVPQSGLRPSGSRDRARCIRRARRCRGAGFRPAVRSEHASPAPTHEVADPSSPPLTTGSTRSTHGCSRRSVRN